MTDPIADMLIRIKNGYMARLPDVAIPYSKMKEALAHLLQQLGYISEVTRDDATRTFIVKLKYIQDEPALSGVKRLSKPGLRRYVRFRDLNLVRRGLGQVVLSTPKGLITNFEAKKLGTGGELICAVW